MLFFAAGIGSDRGSGIPDPQGSMEFWVLEIQIDYKHFLQIPK
jgi:hypothetical protein